jgi:hypothetical protein
MVESDIVFLYVRSCVWEIIYAVGPVWRLYRPLGGLPCDVRQRKVLDIAIDEVSGALSMHTVPPAI